MFFQTDEQQRDFAASIDAALGAADMPAADTRMGRGGHAHPAARCGRNWPIWV